MSFVMSDDLLLLLETAAIVLLAEDPGRRDADTCGTLIVG